jgi:hypothetical protein
MGLSSVPADLSEEGYEAAFALAASTGEVVLVQRTPPWEDMISGDISDETASATKREVALAESYGVDLFVAIDPIDVVGGVSEIAALPGDLRGSGFADEAIHQAFLAYVRYVAQNYEPAYLALGVEVNSYQHDHPEDFERFVVLYHEAYEAVKQISPDTLVFPTFQYEELQGLLPAGSPRPPQWYLLNRFTDRMDLLGVTSFPALAFDDLTLVPDSYYAQLRAFSDAPIALTSFGYPSEGGEADQARYLESTMEVAQQLAMPLLVWFLGQDLTFGVEVADSFLDTTGLRHQEGSEKEAWQAWAVASRRPLNSTNPVDPVEEQAPP